MIERQQLHDRLGGKDNSLHVLDTDEIIDDFQQSVYQSHCKSKFWGITKETRLQERWKNYPKAILKDWANTTATYTNPEIISEGNSIGY